MSAIRRTNELTFIVSHFLRAYLVHLYENGKELPRVDKVLVKNAYKTISKKSVGPKSKNTDLLSSLEDFYRTKFVKQLTESTKRVTRKNLEDFKYSATNLSFMIAEEIVAIEVSYHEHVKRNFVKFLRQFVNQMFKKEHQTIIENYTGSKHEIRGKLKHELKKVKDALLNDNLDCDPKYHDWVKKYRLKILPAEYKKSYELDIQRHPYRYFSYLLCMSKTLENLELKTFQAIPLRTDVKDKYVTVTTNALLDIFPFPNKKRYLGSVSEHAYEFWTMFFNLKGMKINKKALKRLHFNYRMETDGFAVSLSFATEAEMKRKRQRCDRMQKAAAEARREYADKSFAEIEELKNRKKAAREEKEIQLAEERKKREAEYRKKYRQMNKDEQEKVKTKSRLKAEFCYIEDLIKAADHLRDLKKFRREQRFVYIDPGKKSIGTFMNDNGEIFNYRNRRRVRETKRVKYDRLIKNRKVRTDLPTDEELSTIAEKEVELAKFSKKSSNLKTFLEYTKKKMSFWRLIKKENSYQEYLQKLNWFRYINTKRHEDRILNDLEKKYGKDAVMVVGDWSGKGNIKYMSTPGIGFRRKLAERFRVHLVDEYKTSILNCHTKEPQKNLRLSVNGKERRLHSVLTYQMGDQRIGCINRDRNAVMNMREIVHSLIDEGTRPKAFQRTKTTKSQPSPKKSRKTPVSGASMSSVSGDQRVLS